MKQRLYLAASRWAKASREEENIRLWEAGNKRCLRNQRKYVQNFQRSQGIEDASRQLCQAITTEFSESSKKCSQTNIQGWLNLMSHFSSPLELWFQLPTLESYIAKCNKNWPSSSKEQRLYLAATRWAKASEEEEISGSRREEAKTVFATSESTYKVVSKVRESKMSAGSSVRSLLKIFLKATRNEID